MNIHGFLQRFISPTRIELMKQCSIAHFIHRVSAKRQPNEQYFISGKKGIKYLLYFQTDIFLCFGILVSYPIVDKCSFNEPCIRMELSNPLIVDSKEKRYPGKYMFRRNHMLPYQDKLLIHHRHPLDPLVCVSFEEP